jgi:hypothetical protein
MNSFAIRPVILIPAYMAGLLCLYVSHPIAGWCGLGAVVALTGFFRARRADST